MHPGPGCSIEITHGQLVYALLTVSKSTFTLGNLSNAFGRCSLINFRLDFIFVSSLVEAAWVRGAGTAPLRL
ncbi:hypothetical protein Y032_0207g2013 [Ancylostoma ceylanicum]|uniref:Uncharacterized protein n=1 Tax=Ancylostoma ceylanicum TaxID=53326 RepID=A0A016SLT8_9BILA|nr:hypothetical protein Y032_0207g2013 [Ancylostoma ceylanicum]